MTDGHTADAGWGVWCEWRLQGIYNHLSSLNPVKREVYYFQDEEICCTGLDTLVKRQVLHLPNRVPIAQTNFSPDGRFFGFIHADRATLQRELADYEVRHNMDQFDWMHDHQVWRNRIPCTIAIIDTATGAYREVRQLDHDAHHLLFLDNERLLLNHPKNNNGMWSIRLDGSDYRRLRPPDPHGTICHQVVTARGIFYETVKRAGEGRSNWLGCYDPLRHTFEEVPLPESLDSYVHTGFDPTGKFHFFEHHGKTHELLSLHQPFGAPVLKYLRTLPPYPKHGQRFHAHPFLALDRNWLIHTEVIDGLAQICALDVRDLVDRPDYWDLR